LLLAQGHVPTANSSGVLARTEPEDREPMLKAIHESAASLSLFDFTRRVRAQSGEIRWMRSLATPHREPNGDVVWDGITLDITDQKRAEARLAETEQRFADVAKNVPGDLFRRILYPDGRLSFEFVTKNARDMFGLDPTKLEEDGSRFYEAIHAEDRERWMDLVRKTAETLDQFDCEFRARVPDGHYRWFRTIASTRRGAGGEAIWDGVTLDIDAMKRNEVALRRSQNRLRLLTGNLPVAVLQFARAADGSVACAYASRGILTLLGETPEAVEADMARVHGAIEPADRAALERVFAESAGSLRDIRWHGRLANGRRVDAILHPVGSKDGGVR
jgi:PAS domain S-box-containing protein